MQKRAQRLEVDEQKLAQKQNALAQKFEQMDNADYELSEVSFESSKPTPRTRTKQQNEKKSTSTTSSSQTLTTPRPEERTKFIKKQIPTAEKITVSQSPRGGGTTVAPATTALLTKSSGNKSSLLGQSSLLARAQLRQELHDKGLELKPGTFDKQDNDDTTSSDEVTAQSEKFLFGAVKKSFLKKRSTDDIDVPQLVLSDSDANTDRQNQKKNKKSTKSSAGVDTDDDSYSDFIGETESPVSDGIKTPTLTPRKGILKSPKDFVPKESEHSVQFSDKLFSVKTDEEHTPTPPKNPRSTHTPRRVLVIEPKPDIVQHHQSLSSNESDTESISTALVGPNILLNLNEDITDNSENIPKKNYRKKRSSSSESPVDNMFANLVIDNELSPRQKKKSLSFSPKKKQQQPIYNDTSDDEYTKIDENIVDEDEIPEELTVINYSDDFSNQSESTIKVPVEKRRESVVRKPTMDDQQVQVDLFSLPYSSQIQQTPTFVFLNQPSNLVKSVIQQDVLQSMLTTNPVLLAIDDLVRQQTSLLKTFIHLQRSYYESTVRNIKPDHIYVTKENTMR
ncbi:unnamed protein product, partial [Didymodactylos carnosus]